jgi:hypothetical protein
VVDTRDPFYVRQNLTAKQFQNDPLAACATNLGYEMSFEHSSQQRSVGFSKR